MAHDVATWQAAQLVTLASQGTPPAASRRRTVAYSSKDTEHTWHPIDGRGNLNQCRQSSLSANGDVSRQRQQNQRIQHRYVRYNSQHTERSGGTNPRRRQGRRAPQCACGRMQKSAVSRQRSRATSTRSRAKRHKSNHLMYAGTDAGVLQPNVSRFIAITRPTLAQNSSTTNPVTPCTCHRSTRHVITAPQPWCARHRCRPRASLGPAAATV